MADTYSQIAELGQQLSAIDQKMREILAPLRAQRAEIQAKMEDAASRLVAEKSARIAAAAGTTGPVATRSAPTGPAPIATGPTLVAPLVQKLAPLVHLPPRRLKLLRIVAERPGADYAYLVEAMYGRDEKATRGALSAEFSALKADELVKAVDRGQFHLTELGRTVLKAETARQSA